MSNANDMAFPVLGTQQTPNGTIQLGLTKRELFATMAMQGICAGPDYEKMTFQATAKLAIQQADALLAELEKPQ